MTTTDDPAARLELEVTAALEEFLVQRALIGTSLGQREPARQWRDAAILQLQRIGQAAEACGAGGLQMVCGVLEVNIASLADQSGFTDQEQHRIEQWPALLLDHLVQHDTHTALALVQWLQDRRWPLPLSEDEAPVVLGLLLDTAAEAGHEPAMDAAPEPATAATTDGAGIEGWLQSDFPDDASPAPAVPPDDEAGTLRDDFGTMDFDLGAELGTPAPQAGPAEPPQDADETLPEPPVLAGNTFARVSHATRFAWMADMAERRELPGLQDICLRLQGNIASLQEGAAGLPDDARTRLEHMHALGRAYLDAPGDAAISAALLETMTDPAWPEPIPPEEVELLRMLLTGAHPDPEPPGPGPGPGKSDSAPDGARTIGTAPGTTAEWPFPLDIEPVQDAPDPTRDCAAPPAATGSPGIDGEPDPRLGIRAWNPDDDDIAGLFEEERLPPTPPPRIAPSDESTDDPAAPALEMEALPVQVQLVSRDLLVMLSNEIVAMLESLVHELSTAADSGAGVARAESHDHYTELLARLAMASDAVGLAALKLFLDQVAGRVTAAPLEAAQRQTLGLLPGLLLIYLGNPTDQDVCDELVDLLRSDVWPIAMEPSRAAWLARGLAMVQVENHAADMPERVLEVSAEDLSLRVPDDVSPELLDGLLQELPQKTSEFTESIQRLAEGNGTLADLDTAQRAAHTLKGAANTVGIRGVATLTHHLEDILVALSGHRVLPGRALGQMLVTAGDCLEAMSEALQGIGPEPDDTAAVMQQVLEWAHRADRGEPLHDADDGEDDGAQEAAAAHPEEEVTPRPDASGPTGPVLRVPAALVDELLRLAGEALISNSQLRDRLQRVIRQNRLMREHNAAFAGLAAELEELVDIRGVAAPYLPNAGSGDFDPLEFERYGELHTISRRILEAANDGREMGNSIEDDLSQLSELLELQARLNLDSQNAVMRTRMVPASSVVSRLQRSVRQAARLLDKRVHLEVEGVDTPIDSNVLGELVDPLMHMLRNSVDHGIEAADARARAGKPEQGRITLTFARAGAHVVIRCRDDGGGLDLAAVRRTAEQRGMLAAGQNIGDDDLARLILMPGFSTRTETTQVSGRGIGMDVVANRIRQMKGNIALRSAPGQGLTIELRLPAVLLSTYALLVQHAGQKFALSTHGITDIHLVDASQLRKVGDTTAYPVNGVVYPLLDLDGLLRLPPADPDGLRASFPVLLVDNGTGNAHAIRVYDLLDSQNLVIKPLGRYVPRREGVVGATILGDGSVAPVVDLVELLRGDDRAVTGVSAERLEDIRSAYARDTAPSRLSALVVDDSLTARRVTGKFMKEAGFDVRMAIDGLDAVAILEKWTPDILLVDMEMPRMNGLELAAHVRARSELSAVPIVMVTSRSTEKHRRQAESAGVNLYLTKPFSEEVLLKYVQDLAHTIHGTSH